MDVIIDTNAYVAYTKNEGWATDVIDRLRTIYVPFVVIGEIYFGSYNGSQAAQNIKTFQLFCQSPRVIVLHTSESTARQYGDISSALRKGGKPMQTNDIWIAALCKENGLPLLTKDKGFQNILGLDLI